MALNRREEGSMITDDLGRAVPLQGVPQRIVSLCPSQTELLFDLGAGDRVVGVTKFCIHPEEARTRPRVGGTKNVSSEKVRSLSPDLILAQKEENTKEIVEALAAEFPVYVTDVTDVASALSMIERVGLLVDLEVAAAELSRSIRKDLESIPSRSGGRALYLIWRGPWMAAGPETFIHSVLEACGFENAVRTPRYPELDADAIRALAPDWVLLSSEPFPFRDTHKDELRAVVPNARIEYVDGEVFSWYGSRMTRIALYARKLASL